MHLIPPDVDRPVVAAFSVGEASQPHTPIGFDADWTTCGSIRITTIPIGETTYRLTRPVRATFFPGIAGSGELLVEMFSPVFVGRGPTWDAAFNDWRDQVHSTFQRLYRTRPFEFTDGANEQWAVLQDTIDIVTYHNAKPLVLREIGEVHFDQGQFPRSVRWYNGMQEQIDLDLMPASFAGLGPGQWFEAIVERDQQSGRMLRTQFAQPISPIHPLSRKQLDRFWASLQPSSAMPSAEQ